MDELMAWIVDQWEDRSVEITMGVADLSHDDDGTPCPDSWVEIRARSRVWPGEELLTSNVYTSAERLYVARGRNLAEATEALWRIIAETSGEAL